MASGPVLFRSSWCYGCLSQQQTLLISVRLAVATAAPQGYGKDTRSRVGQSRTLLSLQMKGCVRRLCYVVSPDRRTRADLENSFYFPIKSFSIGLQFGPATDASFNQIV